MRSWGERRANDDCSLDLYWHDCERQREREGRDKLREREQKLWTVEEVACQRRGEKKGEDERHSMHVC